MAEEQRVPAGGGGSTVTVVAGVIGIVASIYYMEVVGIVLLGMLPTTVAYLTDRRPEKYSAFCVGAMNACGVLPVLLDIWTEGGLFGEPGRTMHSPFTWASAYGAAAIGWTIYYVAPGFAGLFLRNKLERQIETLKEDQEKLLNQWGRGVTNAMPDERSKDSGPQDEDEDEED